MRVVIYEDNPENFYPLNNLLPQFDLYMGMKKSIDHTRLLFKTSKIDVIARPQFDFGPVRPQGPTLYLSSKLLLAEALNVPKSDRILMVGKEKLGLVKTVASYPASIDEIKHALATIKGSQQVKGIVVSRLWDLIANNETLMNLQFKRLRRQTSLTKGLHVLGKRGDLHVARGAKIHKGVFFDLTEGAVYVDRGAIIRPFTTIVGPSYIGPGTIVDRAKIIKSSIGPHCRIGGEVEACIFQGYSNKYHEGFIGHSFIGNWVNLGALTTNSDLKNNYGPIRLQIGKSEFDTGQIKLGCFIGDQTKLGIGTLIPTGAVIGSFVNFARGGMMPRFVPDFRWISPDENLGYDLMKAISTARVVMKRRNVKMSAQYERMIRTLHEQVRRSN
jgi:UDP-N-acetylglucosamine diphosphorylase/glucosamine-1-phosphate N-acetyltransferase